MIFHVNENRNKLRQSNILQIIRNCQVMGDNSAIGHYILGKTIGQGGFAKVKLARHNITNIEVAVKIINKKKMKNKNMISKVKRQIRILKFINHPNIIKLYEVLDTTSDIFIIMELATKGQLYENMQADMNEDQARFYFKQIIDGVEYIHRNHISHRDLKPENILIDQNNLIKIGDFGLSNLMKDGKLLKTPCGSPFYAAPEILSQQKYEGKTVDIWSSGVILYALIVGALPFDDQNTTKNNMKIKTGSYRIPENVSPFAKDLIMKMLQVDPRNRITIPQIRVHPWIINEVPIYMKISDYLICQREIEPQIDEEILSKIKMFDISFHGYTQQKIRKAILKRDDESFAIAYELLKSDKDRKFYVKNRDLEYCKNSIFSPLQNIYVRNNPPVIQVEDREFKYGKFYEKNLKQLYDALLKTLENNHIQYQIKNNQFCFKCAIATQVQRFPESEMVDESEESTLVFSKEDRYNKNAIKFTIQIYEVRSLKFGHVVDMQISQGHPLVFFRLCEKLYREIK